MAHNLETRNGKTSFASTLPAWHGLGTIVKDAMTSKEAIQLAGLDYNVIKVPLLANVSGVGYFEMPENFATVRQDNNVPLGVVGSRYEIVQNSDAFCFFDTIVGQNQAIFETAGVLGKGERIFITAKMPNYIRIAGTDDLTEVYVILTSSHDGSGSIVAAITGVRIVCANTLRLALKNTVNKVTIRHTKSAEKNLMEAGKLLGITNTYIEKMNVTFNELSLKRMNDSQMKAIVEQLFPSEAEASTRIENIRKDVMNSYHSGVGQSEILGSAWAGLNGVTHYLSHVRGYSDADSKFTNLLMDGTASKITDKAVELLLAM